MSLLKVVPNFVPENNQFFFTSKELNSFQRAEYMDTFGFYQRLFNVFSYMRLDRMFKYTVHSIKGNPLKWQPYTSCSYNDAGSLSIGRRSITPCPAYLKESWCHDELFNSCYEQMVQFTEGGEVGLSAEGVMVFNQVIDEIMTNAALATRLLLTLGQVYDPTAVEFNSEVTAEIKDLFARTTTTCRGWVKLLQDLADEGKTWLNQPDILPTAEFTEADFTGSILDIYDALKSAAPKELRTLINSGGRISSQGQVFGANFIVSDSMLNAVVAGYNAQSVQVATNRPRITVREFGSENAPMPQRVYYIDQTPVIPLADVSGYESYIKGTTHFAGIIASGNIQLGTNFAQLPQDIENNDIGMMVERSDRLDTGQYGNYNFLSHALFQVALGDPNYAVASIVHVDSAEVEPAQPQP